MTVSSTESVQPGIDLNRYWNVLVARWLLIVVCTFLGGAAGVVYLVAAPRVYTASTTVSVFPITTDPYAANRNSGNLVDMTAEAVTASSFKVADVAAEKLGSGWSAASLRTSTTVSAGADNTTMMIAVSAASEKQARAGAAAMAEAYLSARSDQASSSIDSVLTRDRERIQDYRDQLTTAIQRYADEPAGSLASAEAIASQQILNSQISALLTRTNQLEGVDTTGGVILNPASMTQIDVKPATTLTVATGLAVGVLLGIVIAFAGHSRRKIVRGPQDLLRNLEVETIGELEAGHPDESSVASVAQRILRLVSVAGANQVALVFDAAAEWPSRLADRLCELMTQSGVKASVGASDAPGAVKGRLVVLPVAPDASQATRLKALRVSDLTILVAVSGVTRLSDARNLAVDAVEMGAPIAGAILVSSSAAHSGVHSDGRARLSAIAAAENTTDAHADVDVDDRAAVAP